MPPRRLLAALLALAIAAPAAVALADSTPIGPLPPGPVTVATVERGELVSIALPRQTAASGKVWRVARPFDARVARQVAEGELASGPVVVFRAAGVGRTSVRFALTRGDASPIALSTRTLRVTVVP